MSFKSMTVRELIDELQNYSPDMLVGFSYEYGDYANFTAVRGIDLVELSDVKWSSNLRTHKIVEEIFGDEEITEILVLG